MFQIGLSSWIIQDGNYSEFEAGRQYQFALEFYPHQIALETGAESAPRLSAVGSALYDAHGVIVFRSDSAWAIDFGVPAYQDSQPPGWVKVGAAVHGRVYIGVDPFFYFEHSKNEAGVPNLSRQWLIRRILLETTPWVETLEDQRPVRRRDESRVSYVEVDATDSWNHDGGDGHYILECELLHDEPVKKPLQPTSGGGSLLRTYKSARFIDHQHLIRSDHLERLRLA